MTHTFARRAFALVLRSSAALAGLLAPVAAQCTTSWEATIGVPGTDQEIHAMATWDPDGAGPATPVLVLGGQFVVAGTVVASRVATYDPATGVWGTLGAGMNGTVYAIAVAPNGDLLVGGQFTMAGGQPANNVARWNGSAWTALGAGTDARVQALAVLPSGDVVAGGLFTTAGGVPASRIARWDGVAWSPLGSGTNNQVHALMVMPNGALVVGGQFTQAGGSSAMRVARWDGIGWSPFGSGLPVVRSLALMPNGDLLAGTEDIASPFRWDGSNWTELGAPGAGANGRVLALAVLPNGDIIAGGDFWGFGGVSLRALARWNGTAWAPFGSGLPNGTVRALAVLGNGDLVVGGMIAAAGGNVARNLARWDGSAWRASGSGVVFARTMAVTRAGDVVVGCRMAVPGGPDIPTPARWSGSSWSALGGGFGPSRDDVVSALLALSNGHLVAAGWSPAGGTSLAFRVARWDGASWTTFGTLDREVKAMVELPNGDIVVGGPFSNVGGVPAMGIARWDGAAWSPLGTGIINSTSQPRAGDVRALAVLPNGELVAGGSFTVAGGTTARYIASWNGSAWSPVGTGFNSTVYALTVLPGGRLVAGGEFGTAGSVSVSRVAQWDGTSWSALGAGVSVPLVGTFDRVAALATLPDGTLVAGGEFATAGGAPANGIARWNGSAWSTFGSGLNGAPEAFGVLPDGRLAMAGSFSIAGGMAAGCLARVAPTCPAQVVPAGAGCAGTGGAMVLTAPGLPWLGGTYRNLCTGMANGALAASLLGFTPQNTPLAALHPAGGLACSLLTTADAATLLFPAAGVVSHQFALPLNPALVGVTLRNQMLQAELGAGGGIAWLGGSNALVSTTGTY